ncbi:MAG: aminotransferase class V-fold PLP-dependent enzyme [Chloroflexi bacterium]|nr:aminotransferase class V-fold PLP-dependent enzyme [Chloroflexota bacterium]
MTTTSDYLDSAIVRASFPVLEEVTYLNVGTYGIMPEPALKTFQELQADFERKGVASTANVGAKANETRERIAKLLGASVKEIAFTRDATDGINLVLAGLTWQPGDEVITTTEEHEAMIHPLLYLQATKGICVRRVEISPDPDVMLRRLEEVRSPRTRLVGMSHVTCETGTRLPAHEICAWAAGYNILSLFDGAQALGAISVNVREIGCDFYSSNGHKWLCGPKGTGVFYGCLDKLVQLSPAHVGAGSLAWVDVNTGAAEPWASGQRFEYGTRAWALYAGLGASLDWYDSLGWENVERHLIALNRYAKQHIQSRKHLQLLSPFDWCDSSGLVTFKAPGNLCFEMGRMLREQYHIHTRMIPHYNAVRISTAHFNNEADIDKLMAAVDKAVRGN